MYQRVPNSLIEFAENLLRVEKQRDRQTALHLMDLLTDTFFDIKIFKRYSKSLADYNAVTIRNTKELMKNDGIRSILVTGGIVNKNRCSTL